MALRMVLLVCGFWLCGIAGVAVAGNPPAVKVMSFNIRYGTANDGPNHWDKRKDFLADTIRAYDPDLLGTQETLVSQRDYLAAQFPTYGVFAAGRDDGKEKGETAALYWRKDRFKKLDGGHFWLSDMPDQPGSKGWDAALPRVVTWVKLADLKAPDPELHPVFFINTHFDHKGKKARIESAKLLRARIDQLAKGCSVIVTGDFNAGEASEPYAILFGKKDDATTLVDTYRVAHPQRSKNEGTFNGFNPKAIGGARIDWIACSPDWTVKNAAIDRTTKDGRTPSDHFPITATLQR
jgi:endonuclease/exonuclease/phosphatase family metal-dependent hydrolase